MVAKVIICCVKNSISNFYLSFMLDRSAALTNKATNSLVVGTISSAKKSEKKSRNIKSEMVFKNVSVQNSTSISNEEVIEDKFERDDEVEVFFTKEQKLLAQYYVLREALFREVDERYKKKHPEDCKNWEECDGSENIDDRHGSILVAVNSSGEVVGGMRFLISNWSENTLNEEPLEEFTIRSFLQKAGLNYKARFSEVDDVVVDKSYRDRSLLKKMFSALNKESSEVGCEYIVGIAILSASRNHRITQNSLGYQLEIMSEYPWLLQQNHGYEIRYPLVVHINRKLSNNKN